MVCFQNYLYLFNIWFFPYIKFNIVSLTQLNKSLTRFFELVFQYYFPALKLCYEHFTKNEKLKFKTIASSLNAMEIKVIDAENITLLPNLVHF